MADALTPASKTVAPVEPAEAWPPPAVAWMTVALLMLAYFLSYVDRTILSLLVEPVRRSLSLNDTQIGLLQSAFGVFFTIASFPAGWMADKSNRMRLVSWGVAIWSVMTMLCGFCANFVQLFLARMGTALGEASLQPTAPTIISDNFPPERRTLPLSVYGIAGASGLGFSMIAGGAVSGLIGASQLVVVPGLGTFEPWQLTFLLVGAPGLIVALLFFFSSEPVRRSQDQATGTFREFIDVVKGSGGTLVPLVAGVSVYFIYSFAYIAWAPAFYMRVHGWTIAEVGFRFGSVHLIAALTGGWFGGWLARKLWQSGKRNANLLTTTLLKTAAIGPGIAGTLVSDGTLALALLGLMGGLHVGTAGPTVAAIQEIIPNRMRGRTMAIYYAVVALVGQTFGPVLIGLLNDYFFEDPASIGKSLALAAALTLPLSTVLMLVAARNRTKLEQLY